MSYGGRRGKTVFGDWDELKAILDANADSIDYYDVENDCRNSAVPMLDLWGINARIEPGAIHPRPRRDAATVPSS